MTRNADPRMLLISSRVRTYLAEEHGVERVCDDFVARLNERVHQLLDDAAARLAMDRKVTTLHDRHA